MRATCCLLHCWLCTEQMWPVPAAPWLPGTRCQCGRGHGPEQCDQCQQPGQYHTRTTTHRSSHILYTETSVAHIYYQTITFLLLWIHSNIVTVSAIYNDCCARHVTRSWVDTWTLSTIPCHSVVLGARHQGVKSLSGQYVQACMLSVQRERNQNMVTTQTVTRANDLCLSLKCLATELLLWHLSAQWIKSNKPQV